MARVLLIAMAFSCGVAAAQEGVLFTPPQQDSVRSTDDETPARRATTKIPIRGGKTVRRREMRIDFARLAHVKAMIESGKPATLDLNLFDDVVLKAIDVRLASTSSGGYSLSGQLDGGHFGTAVFVVNGKVVKGTVRSLSGTYTIDCMDVCQIRKVDPSSLPPLGEPLRPPPPMPSPIGKSGSASASPGGVGKTDDETPVVDILFVYTPAAREAMGGELGTLVQVELFVAETNRAYADSGVDHELFLTKAVEVDYDETGYSLVDLPRLRDKSDGHMDIVHELRDETGSDLVHLVVKDSDVCGRGYLMTSVGSWFESWGFGFTGAYCGGATFAHELGHNMGLAHDRYDDTYVPPLPYGYGYVNQAAFARGAPKSSRWRTIMAYWDQCDDAGFYCPSLLRFSNPDQDYGGDPLGVADAADARRSLNDTAPTVADFRQAGPRPIPATALSASNATQTTVDLSWTLPAQPQGATVDNILVRRPRWGGRWSTVATLTRTATSHTATGLAPGSSYTFRVRLDTKAGYADSQTVTATTVPNYGPPVVNSMTLEGRTGTRVDANGRYYLLTDSRADVPEDPVPEVWNVSGEPLHFEAVWIYADGAIRVDIDPTYGNAVQTQTPALDPTVTYVIRLSYPQRCPRGRCSVTVVHQGDIADVRIVPDNADEVEELYDNLYFGAAGSAVVTDEPLDVIRSMTVEDSSLWQADGRFVFHDNRADTANDPVPEAWNIYGQPLEFDALAVYADGGVQVDIDTADDSDALVSSALDPTITYAIRLSSRGRSVTVVHDGDIADVRIVPDNASEVAGFHDTLTPGTAGTAVVSDEPSEPPEVVNSMTVEDASLWEADGRFVFHDNRADTANDPVPEASNIYGQPLEFDALAVYADGSVQVDIDTEDDSDALVSSALDPTISYAIRLSSGDLSVTIVHQGDIADVKIVPDNAGEVAEFHDALTPGTAGTAVVSDDPG